MTKEVLKKHKMAILFPIILVVIGILYYTFDPTIPDIPFPKCPMKFITGYNCPSCGIQRAVHCVLHGEFMEALHYNLFLTISIPFAIIVILASWYNFNHVFDGLNKLICNRYVLITYIILYFSWWIIRNILNC